MNTSPVVLNEDQAIQVAINMLGQGASMRAAAEASGLSRRQVSKLKVAPKADDPLFEVAAERRISQGQAVRMIHGLSIRPQGVKRSEMSSILRQRYGTTLNESTGVVELDMTIHQYRYLKESVRAVPGTEMNPLIVPEWMPRENALYANSEMLRMVSELQDIMTDRVLE